MPPPLPTRPDCSRLSTSVHFFGTDNRYLIRHTSVPKCFQGNIRECRFPCSQSCARAATRSRTHISKATSRHPWTSSAAAPQTHHPHHPPFGCHGHVCVFAQRLALAMALPSLQCHCRASYRPLFATYTPIATAGAHGVTVGMMASHIIAVASHQHRLRHMVWYGMVDVCDGCLAAEASRSSFG